jgi:hypothetical protein
MVLQVVGLVNVVALGSEGRRPAERLHAMLSLGVWIVVLVAGRTIVYV